jgi:hypothetical protein
MKTKKAKKGFMDGYKTYDPNTEGYGSPDEWRSCFYERLGFDKAVEVLGEDDPLQVMEISSINPTWDDILKAYRKLLLKWHPDRWHNVSEAEAKEILAKAKKVIAAFEILEERYKK